MAQFLKHKKIPKKYLLPNIDLQIKFLGSVKRHYLTEVRSSSKGRKILRPYKAAIGFVPQPYLHQNLFRKHYSNVLGISN